MANIVHPIFGAIDPSVPGFWDTTVTFGGRAVAVDLTVDGPDLHSAELNNLPRKVEELEPLDRQPSYAHYVLCFNACGLLDVLARRASAG